MRTPNRDRDRERVFFHNVPSEVIVAEVADPGSTEVWLLAAALSAVGRFGEALTVLGIPSRAALAGGPPIPAGDAAACAVAASVCRQLELYPAALVLDRGGVTTFGDNAGAGLPGRVAPGHRMGTEAAASGAGNAAGKGAANGAAGGAAGAADGDPDGAALFDCRLGLVADHVGLGDLDGATRLLRDVEAEVPSGWRARVRLGWLRTEVALMSGDPAIAVITAGDALALADSAGAPRHRVKSMLFLAVAEQVVAAAQQTDRSPGSEAALLAAAVAADDLEAMPLAWPAWWMLADSVGEEPNGYARNQARTAIRSVLAGLDEPLRVWFGGRPAPRRVLAS